MVMENFGDQSVSAKLEDTKVCDECGVTMQLRDTGYGNAWAHVKVDGNTEMLSAGCFPVAPTARPKLGETVIVRWSEDSAERAAIVCDAPADAETFTVFALPRTRFGVTVVFEVAVEFAAGERSWRRP